MKVKTKRVEIQMAPAEYEKVAKAAGQCSMPIATFIRSQALVAAERPVPATPDAPAGVRAG